MRRRPSQIESERLAQRALADLERDLFRRVGSALHERYRLGHPAGVPPGIALEVPTSVDFERGAITLEAAAAWLLCGLFHVEPERLVRVRRASARTVGVFLDRAPPGLLANDAPEQ